jgi:uncharacterized protein (TIGR02246 family)
MRRMTFSLLLLGGLLHSQGILVPQTDNKNKDDETQIRAIVQSETDAWNRGDAQAFGAHYAEDGSFTNVLGKQFYGRQAFIAQHALIFSTIHKGSHNSFSFKKNQIFAPGCGSGGHRRDSNRQQATATGPEDRRRRRVASKTSRGDDEGEWELVDSGLS